MANSLEKFFLGKVKQMPPVEFEMTPDQLRKPAKQKNNPQAIRGKRVLPSPGAVNSSSPVVTANSENLIINIDNVKKPDLGRTPLVVQVASSSSISLALDGVT